MAHILSRTSRPLKRVPPPPLSPREEPPQKRLRLGESDDTTTGEYYTVLTAIQNSYTVQYSGSEMERR